MKSIYEGHKGGYGAVRITKALREQGHGYDGNTLAASLRRQGLRARAAKRLKATPCPEHDMPVAPALLERAFLAESAHEKWVQDITYLRTEVRMVVPGRCH